MNEGLEDPPPIMAVDPKTKGKVPHEVPHGTRAAYNRHGCRCVHCRLAQTVYMREHRGYGERKKAEHGTRAKYVGGCRCEPCTVANREYQRVWHRLNRLGISMRAEWE